MTFEEVNLKQSFPELEKKWVNKWKEDRTFEASVNERSSDKEFIFYDGPPFATGLPHYGHILAGTMKDVVPRYKTMKGYKVERVFGWDCHGLPIENLIEKELNLKSKKDIEDIGVDKFNEACRASVLKYANEWEQTVDRMGRWVDFKNDYKTMDLTFMESIWWVFGQLWEKELIYKGYKAMHVCPRCETPLSNFEVTLGYQDITDCSAIARFRVVTPSQSIGKYTDKPMYLLAWTTTPWTLPGNMLLAVNSELSYVVCEYENERYICAESLASKIFENKETTTIAKLNGLELVGSTYKSLFEYCSDKNYYKVVEAKFVTDTDGTGIVHIAGGYGEDDMNVAVKNKLQILQHVGPDGRIKPEIKEFAGMEVKPKEDPSKTDRKIVEYLKNSGQLFKAENYRHSYPHCWRCDSPLLNFAMEAWFVKIEKIKATMLKENKKVHWTPSHVGEGRFHEWLTNARDWCISRNRYWGTPLPLWIGEKTKKVICIKSSDELATKSGKKITDLHKHYVDNVTFIENGEIFKRIPEVLDCWFESGSMPYAQMHYPFENKKRFESNFPAEFIAEGLDQTRGWFYTLMVLGCAIFKKSPFKNIIVNGLVLAEDGKKMSKKLKNYPDVETIFQSYGADALRMYLMNSPVVKAEPLRFSERGVGEVIKNIHLPLWNAYHFFVTYSNIDHFKPKKIQYTHPLDLWIHSELEKTIRNVGAELENYDLQKASEAISPFIDTLTNWYIRRSRRRFWKSENDKDKDAAYMTLYTCLVKLSQILAPFMPFLSEEIYTSLTGERSVHLSNWPKANVKLIDEELNAKMDKIKTIVTLGHSVRAKKQIKVRQPLSKIKIACKVTEDIDIAIIREELNIKQVEFVANPDDIAQMIIVPDSRKLGPRLGSKVQDIIKSAKAGKGELTTSGRVKIDDIVLESDEFTLNYVGKNGLDAVSDKGIVIALDTEITQELEDEGIARDVIRLVQEKRKTMNFNVADRIETEVNANAKIIKALEKNKTYLSEETLTDKLSFKIVDSTATSQDDDLSENNIEINLKRIV